MAAGTDNRPVVIDAAHVLTLSVAQYVIAFIGSAIVARALGPEGRGEYYLPLLAATTCVTIGKLGIDQANVFLYATSGIERRRLSAQNGFIALCCGVLLAASLALLPRMMPHVFGGTPVRLLLIAGITIPLGIHAQLTGTWLAMTGGVRRQYVAGLWSAVVQTFGAVVLYLLGLLSVRVSLALAVLGAAVTWAVVAKPLSDDPRQLIGLDLSLLRRTLRSALVLHVGMILFFLHLRVDMFMVQAWLGTAALGHYSVSVTLAETLMLATNAVAIAVLPTQMENTIQESAVRAIRAGRINGVLGLGLACAAAIVSAPAIRLLFGKAYLPAVVPMLVLLPGIVSLGVQRVCGPPMLRAGRPAAIAGIYAATLCANIVLNTIWIPRLGMSGAALASSVSYIAGSLLFLTATSRLARMPLSQTLRFDAVDLEALSSARRQAVTLVRQMVGW